MTLEGPAAVALDDTQTLDVRAKYHEARSNEGTFHAMQLARQIAEAVCDAMEDRVRSATDAKYKKRRDLSERLSYLEDNAEAVALPKEILAALHTLRAYGNYASHYERGQHRPPQWAVTSAMGSLDLVVHWFLFGGTDPSKAGPDEDLSLRAPPPAAPRFLERRGILLTTRTLRPRLLFSFTTRRLGSDIFVDPSEPPEAQLAALLSYYASLIRVCEGICRVVLSRETTRDVSKMGLEQLSLLFSQLAAIRPGQVPTPAHACVEDVLRRRSNILSAIRLQTKDISPFILEARQQDPVELLTTWFQRDYLRPTWFERRGGSVAFALVVAVMVVVLGGVLLSVGEQEGKSQRSLELRVHFCDSQTVTPPAICDELRAPHSELVPWPAASASSGH